MIYGSTLKHTTIDNLVVQVISYDITTDIVKLIQLSDWNGTKGKEWSLLHSYVLSFFKPLEEIKAQTHLPWWF
jgi:hypothetical protein